MISPLAPCSSGITVLSLREARLLLWGSSSRVISVASPGGQVFEPELPVPGEGPDLCVLFFSDAAPDGQGVFRTRHASDPALRKKNFRVVPFDERMAHKIADFLERTDPAKPLYVQCLGGISRSVALAQAIGEWAGEPPIYGPIADPNPHVYAVMRRVLEQRTELAIEQAAARQKVEES